MVLAEHLLVRLRKYGRSGLTELRYTIHVVVKKVGTWLGHAMSPHISLLRTGCAAVSMILGNLRGELVVEVVGVERGSHAVALPTMTIGDIVEIGQVEVVEVVEIDQVAKVLVGRSVHTRPRLRVCIVHCVRRTLAGGGASGKKLDLRSASNFLRLRWWGYPRVACVGRNRKRMKTLDALLQRVHSGLVSWFTSLRRD